MDLNDLCVFMCDIEQTVVIHVPLVDNDSSPNVSGLRTESNCNER